MDKWFVFYNYCIPVRGAKRSLVCDLDNKNFFFIEASDYEIVKGLKVKEDQANHELLTYLVEQDVGFYTETPELFPVLKNEYLDYPLVDNAIVEIEHTTSHLSVLLNKYATDLGIKYIEIRYLSTKLDLLYTVLDLISTSEISSISLCINQIVGVEIEVLLHLIKKLSIKYKELEFVGLFNQEEEENRMIGNVFVVRKTKALTNFMCGEISPINFNITIKSFQQAMNCNVCLDRKIAVDKLGNVKNCLSMLESYGEIKNVDLKEILVSPSWSKKNIKKDHILVCKDCEFRYICHDCRAYLPDNELNSKPAKCKYNPYTTKWGE